SHPRPWSKMGCTSILKETSLPWHWERTDRKRGQSEGIMSEGIQNDIAPALSQFCHEHQSAMLSILRQAVEIESPSDDKVALDRSGQYRAEELERLGGRVPLYPQKEAGTPLKAEFPGGGGSKPLFLPGLFDPVGSRGTLAGMPFRIADG